LKNMMDDVRNILPNIWKTCLKPPTRMVGDESGTYAINLRELWWIMISHRKAINQQIWIVWIVIWDTQ
jgi:hypothetical protein